MAEFETISEEPLFEGHRFWVMRGTYRHPDGEETVREVVQSPDAVAIVAYDDEVVHLVRQPREAIGRGDILEVPAGIMDVEGEAPLDTARRELEEELGLSASAWDHVTTFYASSGYTDERVHVFLATGLERVGEADADGAERIEVVTWPLDELDGLIEANSDAKTLVGLLWLARARR